MNNNHKLIIIGGANAGYTAAIYAARGELKPILFTGQEPGGQLMLTSSIENFPGFPEGINGAELMMKMKKQAENFGAIIKNEAVTGVDFTTRPFVIQTAKDTYRARAVIIATGASATWLGVPGEKKFVGRGVSSCATCDAAFFRGKDTAVVGGGDVAMEDALALTKFASRVYIIHRRDKLRASKVMQERVLRNSKITMIWNSAVEAVVGEEMVRGIKIKNIKTGAVSELALQGLFVAIGHKPNTNFLSGQITLNDKGYIAVKDLNKTNIEGVFAAGDVADYKYRQAITAAASGCQAAMDAEKYLEDLD